jgi:hypothetical protein
MVAKYAVPERDIMVIRNGSNLDCFGTHIIYDVNGVCTFEENICHMFTNGKHSFAFKWPVGGKPMFAQIDSNNEDEEDMHRTFLSVPEYGGAIWSRVIGCEDNTIPEMLEMAQNLELLSEMEEVEGIRCYVLRGSTKYGKVTAWVAPERSYNAVRWTVEKTPSDTYNDYRIGDKATGSKQWRRNLKVTQFSLSGEVFVPSAGIHLAARRYEDGKETTNTCEWQASEISLNPDFAALGAFKFKIPDGTPVKVIEHMGINYVWKDGIAVPDVEGLAFDEIDKMLDKSVPCEK